LYVKMLEVTTRKADHLVALTAAQVVSVALCAALLLWLREVPGAPWPGAPFQTGVRSVDYWAGIWLGVRTHAANFAYLGLICTAAIIALQTWGQRHSTANEAAVIYAFEPACAAFFAYLWLGEAMTAWGWAGAAMLISGMIVSQWNTVRPPSALAPE
jgi:drug/metabolite transporter (DMT)-like permease